MHIKYEIFKKNKQQGILLLLREIAFYLLYSCRNSSNMFQRVLDISTGHNKAKETEQNAVSVAFIYIYI